PANFPCAFPSATSSSTSRFPLKRTSSPRLSPRPRLRDHPLCHPDRRPAPFAGRSGGIPPPLFSSLRPLCPLRLLAPSREGCVSFFLCLFASLVLSFRNLNPPAPPGS